MSQPKLLTVYISFISKNFRTCQCVFPHPAIPDCCKCHSRVSSRNPSNKNISNKNISNKSISNRYNSCRIFQLYCKGFLNILQSIAKALLKLCCKVLC